MTTAPATSTPHTGKHRGLLPFLGLACGASVANIYYNQPLLLEISHTFHATSAQAGWVAVGTQLGFAAGILLFVPLGDVIERRSLVVKLYAVVAAALLAAGVAPSLLLVVAASVAIGVASAVTHVLVPIAPELAEPGQSGRAIGTVMTGLILGILLARTAAGWLATVVGWRGVFLLAGGFIALFVPLLWWRLPKLPPVRAVKYSQALRSLWTLVREQPTLREASVVAALGFGAFSAFWTTLTFLLGGPHYHLGAGVAGTFGIVAAAGAAAASFAGRLADRRGARWVVGMGVSLMVVSWIIFWALGYHLAALFTGVLITDVGLQTMHVGNQTRIFSLVEGARSRVNTIYMIAFFAGGAIGSAVSSTVWAHWQWEGVCALALAMLVISGLFLGQGARRDARRRAA